MSEDLKSTLEYLRECAEKGEQYFEIPPEDAKELWEYIQELEMFVGP